MNVDGWLDAQAAAAMEEPEEAGEAREEVEQLIADLKNERFDVRMPGRFREARALARKWLGMTEVVALTAAFREAWARRREVRGHVCRLERAMDRRQLVVTGRGAA